MKEDEYKIKVYGPAPNPFDPEVRAQAERHEAELRWKANLWLDIIELLAIKQVHPHSSLVQGLKYLSNFLDVEGTILPHYIKQEEKKR